MIVLDTHVLLWWASGDDAQLSPLAARAIATEMQGGQIVVSAISAWELAMLATVGEIEAVRFAPVDNAIAVESVALPGEFHKDSADRIIVATARRIAAPLVTADDKIRAYPHVRTVW